MTHRIVNRIVNHAPLHRAALLGLAGSLVLLSACGSEEVEPSPGAQEMALPPLQAVEISAAMADCAKRVENAVSAQAEAKPSTPQDQADALVALALEIDDRCRNAN